MVFNFAWMDTRKEMEFLRVWNFYRQTFRCNLKFIEVYRVFKCEKNTLNKICNNVSQNFIDFLIAKPNFGRILSHASNESCEWSSQVLKTQYMSSIFVSTTTTALPLYTVHFFSRKFRQEGQDIRITKGIYTHGLVIVVHTACRHTRHSK